MGKIIGVSSSWSNSTEESLIRIRGTDPNLCLWIELWNEKAQENRLSFVDNQMMRALGLNEHIPEQKIK